MESPLSSESPARDTGPDLITSLPFLPDYVWIFLTALVVHESFWQLLVFSENCSTYKCIFDVFVWGGELHVLLLRHLDQSLNVFFKNFIYLFLAVLGLCCCAQAFFSCGEQALLFLVVRGLHIAVASLVVEHGL